MVQDQESRLLPVGWARKAIRSRTRNGFRLAGLLDKVGDIGNFQQELNAMEQQEFITKEDRRILEAALHAGNAAIHRGHAPNESDIQSVLDIVENTLHATYVLPNREQDLRKSIPVRTRKE